MSNSHNISFHGEIMKKKIVWKIKKKKYNILLKKKKKKKKKKKRSFILVLRLTWIIEYT